jgi:hypothetical protein
MFRLRVIRRLAWRASAKLAGSQEDAYLSLILHTLSIYDQLVPVV